MYNALYLCLDLYMKSVKSPIVNYGECPSHPTLQYSHTVIYYPIFGHPHIYSPNDIKGDFCADAVFV